MLLISCSDDGLTSSITACISVINNWRKEGHKTNSSNSTQLTGWRIDMYTLWMKEKKPLVHLILVYISRHAYQTVQPAENPFGLLHDLIPA